MLLRLLLLGGPPESPDLGLVGKLLLQGSQQFSKLFVVPRFQEFPGTPQRFLLTLLRLLVLTGLLQPVYLAFFRELFFQGLKQFIELFVAPRFQKLPGTP